MTNNIPNLFIVGAMKSGTSSLHNYLGTHPEIYMSEFKEPQYFSDQDRDISRRNFKSETEYLDLFKTANNVKIIGEASTNYSKIPEFTNVPQRIKQFSPDAKIIYIMRDPVERALSHYWERVKRYLEGRDLLTTIKNEPEIINVGYYAMQLKPYIETFGSDRIFILTLESLKADKTATLKAIFDWLEVDTNIRVPDTGKHNVGEAEVQQFIGAPLVSILRQTPLWSTIVKLIPKFITDRLRKLTKPVKRDMNQAPEAIAYLRPILQQQTKELTQLLNRQFPEWKTLYQRTIEN
jgi:hypothetical protein